MSSVKQALQAFYLKTFYLKLNTSLKYWYVTHRIKRINRRLERKIGKRAAEKRGLKWALTSFMNRAWDATKEEIETLT